jgi:5-formyltetrahydrofolate cyclo-ligase
MVDPPDRTSPNHRFTGEPSRPNFDPEVLRETTIRAKKQIRQRMKALRSGHSTASLAARSQKIVERVQHLHDFELAKSVALFWPMIERGEVDLRPLDQALRSSGRTVYYPFMERTGPQSFRTGFAPTESAEDLEASPHGFFQPKSCSAAVPGDIDLVLVPALAADSRGHRIGYGAGFYDATLADVRPPARAWIVVYQFQMMAELPNEAHDQNCDCVVTDESIYPALAL